MTALPVSPCLAIFQQIGMPELLVIGFIILLLFGAKRLPELFRSMGKSIGEFKKATRDIEDEVRSAMDTEPDSSSSPSHTAAPETSDSEKEKKEAESAPAEASPKQNN